jgi:hypothetical protein
MKRVATLTVRQDPDEPQLKMQLLRSNPHFYLEVECDHPVIPTLMPLRITPTNFRDAKSEAQKFLHIIRGAFRQMLGKTPDLPEEMKKIELEIPAFSQFLLNGSFLGLS